MHPGNQALLLGKQSAKGKPHMYGPFYRLIDSTDEVRKILDSGEIWGRAPRNFFQSDIPKVKAYAGV